MESSKMKVAYVITKRGNRSFWNRVGVAFVNSDGSLNVKLESQPVNGEVQIRDYVPREDSTHSGPYSADETGEPSAFQAA